ncbi:NAD-dependent epimerase/dehydratase family protein [Streptomyces sp. NPDC001212]
MSRQAVRETVLVTGAGGMMGRMRRPRLRRPGRTLRLLDVAEQHPPGPSEQVEVVTGSVTDPELLREACAGVDAVIHLGGLSRRSSWAEILNVNVDGARCLLEAARHAGVPRVVLASSHHAAGFFTRDDAGPEGLPADAGPRPDTPYGWSKAAVEALGRYYHDRAGMDVICLRIGSCFERPPGPATRSLPMWLSPADGARLLEACLAAPAPAFRIVWGISRNTRRWLSLAEGEAIGYHPEDDSEAYAAELIAEHGEPDLSDPLHRQLGGPFCLFPMEDS